MPFVSLPFLFHSVQYWKKKVFIWPLWGIFMRSWKCPEGRSRKTAKIVMMSKIESNLHGQLRWNHQGARRRRVWIMKLGNSSFFLINEFTWDQEKWMTKIVKWHCFLVHLNIGQQLTQGGFLMMATLWIGREDESRYEWILPLSVESANWWVGVVGNSFFLFSPSLCCYQCFVVL